MPAPSDVPPQLLVGPFTRQQTIAAGLSPKVLRGRRFRQLFRGVWVFVEHVMTDADWIVAATLAMPADAHVSHLTRIQALGLREGPLRPLHFTVAGDLHLAVPEIFLHRTEVLPPTDDVGVTPAMAFIGVCATGRVIDLIKIGDWLLHHTHMTLLGLRELAVRDRWRPGATIALRIAHHLDEDARSPKESETRAVLVFAGLPRPVVNPPLFDDPNTPWTDLWYAKWRLAIEYEGSQHLLDRRQFNRDISRYAWMRDEDVEYVQVTNEVLAQPRALVLHVHRKLVERGYDGPAPKFGRRWRSLFEPASRASPRAEVG